METTLDLKKYKISETFEQIRKEKKLSIPNFSNLCGIKSKDFLKMINTNYSFEKNQVRNICKNIGIPFNAFQVRSLDTNKIKDKERRRLIKKYQTYA